MGTETAGPFEPEFVLLTELKPHPKNYRGHPEDQLEHLVASLQEHGQYRNVAIANDGTILAGHGVVAAATKLEWKGVYAVRLAIGPEDPKALKLLAGDNEVGRLAEVDDRALTDLLKEIMNVDDIGLLGTGFDEQMLAGLVMNTRPSSEVGGFDEAAEWVGMPDYDPAEKSKSQILISFDSREARDAYAKAKGLKVQKNFGKIMSCWWPPRDRRDPASLVIEEG